MTADNAHYQARINRGRAVGRACGSNSVRSHKMASFVFVALSLLRPYAGQDLWQQTPLSPRAASKTFPFGAQTQTGRHPLPNATDESVSKGVKLFFGAVP
jgi:hypothetical protein